MKTSCSPCFAVKLAALAALTIASLSGEAFAAPSCCGGKPKSLQAQLDARQAKSAAYASEGMKKAAADRLNHVEESGVLETAKRAGDTAPNFTLPHADGAQVELAALLEKGPVVITWYRGGWCPYCNLQLSAMQEMLPALEKAGASLVAISPQAPDYSLSTQEKNALEFYVLSDVGNVVGKEYGIVYELDDNTHRIYEERLGLSKVNQSESGELPLPAAYVIDQNGKIIYDFVEADYAKRAEPIEILDVVLALQNESADAKS